MLGHAVWRSLALIFLGIFLRSLSSGRGPTGRSRTRSRRSASATRSLFLLAFTSLRVQVIALRRRSSSASGRRSCCIRCRVRTSTTPQVGVPADWPHLYSGFLAHFNKNSNLSWAFDVWFLNLFPREKPFLFNGGGWSTLSFIPTLATMMLGMWSGEWLKTSRSTTEKLKGLVIAGVALDVRRPAAAVAAHRPDRQADLDVVLHALQRRPGRPDAGGLLRADRVEGMAALGVPAAGDRRELDRRSTS